MHTNNIPKGTFQITLTKNADALTKYINLIEKIVTR